MHNSISNYVSATTDIRNAITDKQAELQAAMDAVETRMNIERAKMANLKNEMRKTNVAWDLIDSLFSPESPVEWVGPGHAPDGTEYEPTVAGSTKEPKCEMCEDDSTGLVDIDGREWPMCDWHAGKH